MIERHEILYFPDAATDDSNGIHAVVQRSYPTAGETESARPESPLPVEELATDTPFDDCNEYQAAGGCDPVVHQRYEGARGDIMRCKTCGRTYSSRRGGVLFKSRLSTAVIDELMDSHKSGRSIRETARSLQLNRGTVRRYFKLFDTK